MNPHARDGMILMKRVGTGAIPQQELAPQTAIARTGAELSALDNALRGPVVPERAAAPAEGVHLNVGAGWDASGGFIRLDCATVNRPHLQADTRCLPLADESCDSIRCFHLLEHIRREDLVALMNEFWRATKFGGVLDIEVPLFPSDDAMADPSHVSFFVSRTFDYFAWNTEAGTGEAVSYGIKFWKMVRRQRLGHNSILGVTYVKEEPDGQPDQEGRPLSAGGSQAAHP